MKLVKMSLVAALLVGSSAFALEDTKISGNMGLFYGTSDADNMSLFEKDASSADAFFNINATTKLDKIFSAGVGYTVVSTLGLENSIVSNVWGNSHTATTGTGSQLLPTAGGAKVENANWMNEAWIAATVGNTTAKLGRMELDTPLAFTETWSVEKNTFEAIVAINTDLPDTTLVGAFVGNGNGNEQFGQAPASNGVNVGGVVNNDGDFTTYGTDGAYTVGAINNSYQPVTAQLWYYDLPSTATAYWLQSDLNMDGILAGFQYSGIDVSDTTGVDTTSDVYALMIGYEKDGIKAKVAYSGVGSDFNAGFNTATSTGASKLYTEAWWSYGYVTRADTTSITAEVEYDLHGIGEFGLFYTMTDHTATAKEKADNEKGADYGDLSEITLTASRSYGSLDTTLAVINETANGHDAVNMFQVYLTYNY